MTFHQIDRIGVVRIVRTRAPQVVSFVQRQPATDPGKTVVVSCIAVVRRDGVVVIGGVHDPREPELLHVAQARDSLRLGFGLRQRWQQESRENGDDGDNHQQFNKGKCPWTRIGPRHGDRFGITHGSHWGFLNRTIGTRVRGKKQCAFQCTSRYLRLTSPKGVACAAETRSVGRTDLPERATADLRRAAP